MQKVVERLQVGALAPPLGGKDSIVIFYLADAKNRQTKRVAIPEKERKLMEKHLEEARRVKEREGRTDLGKEPGPKKNEKPTGAATKETKDLGILSTEEMKEYERVQDKVMAVLRTKTLEGRMKDWIDELKKNAIIEIRL